MLKEAKKQFKEISLEQIKEIIKKLVPAKYDKMIINENSLIERTDYYYSMLKYKVSERNLFALKFPLFEKERFIFSKYEGGENKFGEKSYVKETSDISKMLEFKGVKEINISINEIPNAFDFPLLEVDNKISDKQLPYFLPLYTFSKSCNTCNGHQYVTCPSCNGEHKWQCPTCSGSGKISCSKCNGHGYTKCWSCSGKGTKVKVEYINGQRREKEEKCSSCRGRGEVPCSRCKTTGLVTCSKCSGKGEITCKHCYGDKNRYGMIDCPECLTAGVTAQFSFVTTEIKSLENTVILKTGADINLDTKNLDIHINKDLKYINIYNNVNGNIYDEKDEISDKLMKVYEKELKYTKNSYPILLQEDIKYQIIPCVKITYKHMLTNTEHELTIVNFWNNPDIIFHSDAEKVKTNVKSVSKSAKGFFSKVLKTKKHKEKEDRKTEIKLMIYLAKSDGKIEDEEKEFLADQISHLDDFTNSEKKDFFKLMNSVDLPELTIKDLNFTNEQKANEIIEKLIQLANADGEYELAEKKLIEKIKNLIKEKYQ